MSKTVSHFVYWYNDFPSFAGCEMASSRITLHQLVPALVNVIWMKLVG